MKIKGCTANVKQILSGVMEGIQEDSVSEEDQPIKVSQIWANTVQSNNLQRIKSAVQKNTV
ncbi:unnamed protein product [Oikopleura dioica]|uniref:Uncharacterized protein n=1 Tax=Oikopleura dioica TaxID=34765 RepID=E4YXG8_OIKDI|nr:unnamed protein product [Oikopleura dioica]